jgi:hypothetical protein
VTRCSIGKEQSVVPVSDRIGVGAVWRFTAADRVRRCAECARARSAQSEAQFGPALDARARKHEVSNRWCPKCDCATASHPGLQGARGVHPHVGIFGVAGYLPFPPPPAVVSRELLRLVPKDSKIVTDSEHETLRRFVSEGKAKPPELELLYRGSRDGFAAADFHRLCDGKGPTLTVVQTPQGHVFGGYASASWNSASNYVSAPGSFLFTLRNSRNLPPQMFALSNPQYSMNCDPHSGPAFGGGHDLCVGPGSSYSNFGHSYALPAGCTSDLLAGAQYFTVSELEVFGRCCTLSCLSLPQRVLILFVSDRSGCVGLRPVFLFSVKRCIGTWFFSSSSAYFVNSFVTHLIALGVVR